MLFAMPLHVLPGYLVFFHFIFNFFCKQMAKYAIFLVLDPNKSEKI